MTREIEFYFDCSSPWTYLAFEQVQVVAERTGATIYWNPVLVGGIFNAVNQSVYEARANPQPVKARYYNKDLQDWARYVGITIGRPSVFPVRSVTAMRGAFFALDQGKIVDYARALFRSYWTDLNDISQHIYIEAAAQAAGLDGAALLSYAQTDEAKARLTANTNEVIERGGFGSPTMFVNGADMYFGNDRLPLVEAALLKTEP